MDNLEEFEERVAKLQKESRVLRAEVRETEDSKTIAFFDEYKILRKHNTKNSVAYAVKLTLRIKGTHKAVSSIVHPAQIISLKVK